MPYFAIRATGLRALVLGVAASLAVVTAGAGGADATVIRPAAEPASGLVVTLDGGAAKITAGTPVTYRATITNRGRQDRTNLMVTIDVSGPFVITEAEGGKVRRPAVAQWGATVPAGRVMAFAVSGTFRAIPAATRAVTATGCIFIVDRVDPLVCNSALNGIVRTSGSTSVWTVATGLSAVLSAGLSLVVVVILLLAVFRRGRRRTGRAGS
jgi:hypothetical protein